MLLSQSVKTTLLIASILTACAISRITQETVEAPHAPFAHPPEIKVDILAG